MKIYGSYVKLLIEEIYKKVNEKPIIGFYAYKTNKQLNFLLETAYNNKLILELDLNKYGCKKIKVIFSKISSGREDLYEFGNYRCDIIYYK